MGRIKFRNIRRLCELCNTNLQVPAGKYPDGTIKYKKFCNKCKKQKAKFNLSYKNSNVFDLRINKTCEKCGFIPEFIGQLDVHHKDCNHKNNNLDNLQILCANCHRLVHYEIRVKKESV